MLLQELEENNNIIDVDSRKSSIRAKQTIDLPLHIDERILVFLLAIRYYCQFVTIRRMHSPLIKESRAIDNNNKRIFSHREDNFSLQEKRINV